MSKLAAILTALLLMAGALAVSSPAQARWHHGWHGGGWGYGPSFAFGYGLGYPYYGNPYYARPACGWTRVRVWRGNHWGLHRAWRCW
jgi:hypothetical protein